MTHIIDALQQYYKIFIDWEGNIYCGLTLYWYYNKQTMYISMPSYIQKTLLKFQHPSPKNPEDAPFKTYPKQYEAKVKFSREEYGMPALLEVAIKLTQQNIGIILFYGRAVYMMLMVALIDLESAQSHGTEATDREIVQMLNYCATHPDSFIR